MNITDMIQKLMAIKAEHGDLPVTIGDPDFPVLDVTPCGEDGRDADHFGTEAVYVYID